MSMTYRQYLQYHANNHASAAKRNEARALLNVVGDDGNIDGNFLTGEKRHWWGGTKEKQSNGMNASTINRQVNPWWRDSYNAYEKAHQGESQPQDQGGAVYGGGFGFTGGRGGYNQDARNRADAIAKYDEEIREANDAMGGLGRKQEIGEHNIRHNMHDANVMADNDFNRAKGLYNMQTRDAIDRHKVARDEIEQDTASKIRSAQGILAAGGAGDSSFAKFLAPFKITEAATKQQGQVQDAYSRNRRDLDINYNTVENAYKQNKRKIENDGNARLQALRQKIATARQDLESRIRNANIAKQQANGSSLSAAISSQNAARDRINGIGAEIDDLGRDRSIPVDRVEWKAPGLDSYKPAEVEVKPGDVSSQIGGVKDQIAPNLQPLLEEKKKKEGLL